MQHRGALALPCTRHPGYCYYLFFFTLALLRSVGAQSVRTVGDSDPSVSYVPPDLATNLCATTISDDCKNKWFSEAITGAYRGAVHSTQGPDSTMQITFRGSQIVVKGVTDRKGPRAFVRVDGGAPNAIDTSSPDELQHINSVLYSTTGLDPNRDHTLTIQYDPGSVGRRRPHMLRIDSFEITDGPGLPASTNHGGFPGQSTPSDSGPRATLPSTSDSTGLPNSETTPPPGTDNNNNNTTSNSNSSAVPIVAGLSTGLATLLLAGGIILWLLRRRRAVRVQNVERTSPPPPAAPSLVEAGGGGAGRNMLGLANLAYAFNRRGSSTGSSGDARTAMQQQQQPGPPPRQPLPPVPPPPRINTTTTPYISPYTYQRRGPAYPRSDTESSIGLPVDERPPNLGVPADPRGGTQLSPIAASPRVLRVHNPGTGSSVVSTSDLHYLR